MKASCHNIGSTTEGLHCTVEPLYYGHNQTTASCPDNRGVHILEASGIFSVTTGHYNSIGLHSSGLWSAFLASVHQGRALKHAFVHSIAQGPCIPVLLSARKHVLEPSLGVHLRERLTRGLNYANQCYYNVQLLNPSGGQTWHERQASVCIINALCTAQVLKGPKNLSALRNSRVSAF